MSSNLESKINDNITRHRLLRADAPVIVAVSGGADSVALLAALDALGYQCVAAHCNYHLRGEESNRDMRSVQQLCADLGIDLYMKDFDVEERRARTGESVEMACRELRYRWFDILLDKLRAQAIAVAHHREDNVETFLLNLMRGSGIAGLTGMRPRNGYVVRPMLDLSREDIEDYLRRRGLTYVNDSSNSENIYARNKLRNIVIPALEREFPGAVKGILASIAHLTDNRSLYEQAVSEKSGLYFTGSVIHLDELIAEQPNHRLLLFEMLRTLGYNITHVDNILASADKSGLRFPSGDTVLELSRGKLLVSNRRGPHTDEIAVNLRRDILSPVTIRIGDYPVHNFRPERNAAVTYFDIGILDGNPHFALRRWKRGDRITPFGMRGSRLISDIFSDAKYSAADKRDAWILTRDDEIIWVVGVRSTDRFPVTPETKRYLRLSLE